eukprot:9324458-Pyramimonas_sp.AAC.1
MTVKARVSGVSTLCYGSRGGPEEALHKEIRALVYAQHEPYIARLTSSPNTQAAPARCRVDANSALACR